MGKKDACITSITTKISFIIRYWYTPEDRYYQAE